MFEYPQIEPFESGALVFVGTGGSARDTYSVVAAINQARADTWLVIGFIAADLPSWSEGEYLGVPFLGLESDENVWRVAAGAVCSVGIGDPALRWAVSGRLKSRDFKMATIVHPLSSIGPGVTIGEGSVVYSHTVATTNVSMGRGCQLNVGSTLSHDVRVGDFVSISPGVTVAGNVTIDDGVFIGAGATIIPGVSVGAGSVVGAGATVTRDVAPHTTVVGVPARAI